VICEIGKDTYPLPLDFHQVYDHAYLETAPRDNSEYRIVMLMRLAPAEMVRQRGDLARPKYYAVINNLFVLFPPPDKAYVVHLRYHAQPLVF
jgi:hypothetical protein